MNLFTKILLTLFIAMCITSPSWAADRYLQINDMSGASKIMPCPGGICVLEGFATGNYELSVCDQEGVPVTGRVVLYEQSEMETQEVGSGLATGKRQHKPVRMVSEPGEVVRRFHLKISSEAPVTIRIKDISAIKDGAVNRDASRTNRITQ